MLHKTVLGFAVLALLVSSAAFGAESRFFLLSRERLDAAKAAVVAKEPDAVAALASLVASSDPLLKTAPLPSVTQNDYVGPGGTKHDYVSFAPFWWPDPSKPDGLPYINRDGVRNMETRQVEYGSDRLPLSEMVEAVKILALAWYLTDNEAYGQQAVRYVRCWFLDSETKMNPNLQFGQGIRGHNDGRSAGIIDTSRLTGVVDALGLLEGFPGWTAADKEGMVQWFSAYVDWLRTSSLGKIESVEANNHGTWYAAQMAMYLLYAGREGEARKAIERGKDWIDSQIEADGRQPRELGRARPFQYSHWNLRAHIVLAHLGEKHDVDLWNYTGKKGGSLQKALDFLVQHLQGKKWPYRDLDFEEASGPPRLDVVVIVLKQIGDRYDKKFSNIVDIPLCFELESFY